ncbi:Serine/threonine-protein kinase PrkC [Maioricimonas rarisocia]|uniref:non-specific serine/threonine protein kinase n=1 Tax=Maioricimonas rarisocia TaxID=2528026 RepID=A0A517Z8R6_9PLAN|nr:serine/threonine-protein kinase [Maioricimonas rarisocia]QDU38839.1 Serine/threonine-protein kinase PrkC [Maioricimonas rarisocia]
MTPDAQAQTGSGPPAAEHDQLRRLGKYVIQRRLGAGGMGTVFLAVDEELNRTVALKVLPRDRAENPTLVKRFKAEGQAAASLEHSHIVKVYEAGEADGFLYLALEYIDGIDVQELVRKRGVLPVKRSIAIVRQIAEALQHAYEKKFVHRDIKPSNFLIKADGSVKLADMGLARSLDEATDTNITRAGMTVGTVDYMAPEQARNSKAADIRSDLYSLGCSWFQMLTGRPPFSEGSMTHKLQAHATAPSPDPRGWNDRVPEAVVAVLGRLMAKRPEDRYQTPAELIADLDQSKLRRTNVSTDILAGLSEDYEEPDPAAEAEEPPFTEQSRKRTGRQKSSSAKSSKSPSARRSTLNASSEPETAEADKPQVDRRLKAKRRAKSGRSTAGAARERRKPDSPEADRSADQAGRQTASEPTPTKKSLSSFISVPTGTIDPDKLKFAFFGLLLVGLVGLVGWAMNRAGSNTGGGGGTPAFNPYAPQDVNNASALNSPATAGEDGRSGEGPGFEVQEGPEAGDTQVSARSGQGRPTEVTDGPERGSEGDASARSGNHRPFPGTEDLAAGSEHAVPSWVYKTGPDVATDARRLIVTPSPSAAGQFRTFAEAVAELPRDEGVIVFRGDGPFPVEAADLSRCRNLVVEAASGSNPVLVLSAATIERGDAGLLKRDGLLGLTGLHFVLKDRDSFDGDDVALISAVNCGLAIRNCTVTLADSSNRTTTAVAITSSGERTRNARAVIENVVVRGNQLTAARLDGRGVNFVAGNCLFAAGDAPALVITPSAEQARASEDVEERGIDLQLLKSVVISRKTAIALQHSPSSTPAPCTLKVRHVVFASDDSADGSVPSTWMSLAPWPEGASGRLDESRARSVKLATDRTLWLGWDVLVALQAGSDASPVKVTSLAEWGQFWRRTLESQSVETEVPGLATLPSDHRNITPQVVAAALDDSVARYGATGNVPGIVATALPLPPQGLVDRLIAIGSRPRLPKKFGEAMDFPNRVEFDLARGGNEFASFVNSPKCPDGTHIVLTGTGLNYLQPFTVKGKRLRLEFRSGVDAPFIIQPVAADDPSDAAEALVTVESGTVDLVNAHIRIPHSRRRGYPARVVKVEDGSFSIRNCRLQGPVNREEFHAPPLVECVKRPENGERRYGLILNSFLSTDSACLGGDLSGRLVEVNNSIMYGLSDVLSVRSAATDGYLLMQDSTVTGGQSIVQLASAGDAAGKLHVFVKHSVVTSPPKSAMAEPVVLAMPADALSSDHLTWWEEGVGYAGELKGHRRAPETVPFSGNWRGAYGPAHVIRPLTGHRGVLLASVLPAPERLAAENFRLLPACEAASWHDDGGPIGADVDEVGPVAAPVESKPSGPPRPNGRRRPRSTF